MAIHPLYFQSVDGGYQGSNAIVDDDSLYVGTTYYTIKAVSIPAATALKLNSNEFNFNITTHKLYAKSSNASGLIDIIIR